MSNSLNCQNENTFLCSESNIMVISILNNLKTAVHNATLQRFYISVWKKNQNQKIGTVSKMAFMISPTEDLGESLCWFLIREKLWMGEACIVEFLVLSESIIGSICVIWGRYFSILTLILQNVHFLLNIICGLTRKTVHLLFTVTIIHLLISLWLEKRRQVSRPWKCSILFRIWALSDAKHANPWYQFDNAEIVQLEENVILEYLMTLVASNLNI